MTIKNKLNIAVIGATGYTGLDLIYLLSNHPKVNIKYLCATKNLGKNISYFDSRIKKKIAKNYIIKITKLEKFRPSFPFYSQRWSSKINK